MNKLITIIEQCQECGKETPPSLLHSHRCYPFKKYDRSKRKLVNKQLFEYNDIEWKRIKGEE